MARSKDRVVFFLDMGYAESREHSLDEGEDACLGVGRVAAG